LPGEQYGLDSDHGILNPADCKADGYPAQKQAECFSTQALAGASKPNFEESIPAKPPIFELTDDATLLNVTSLVNKDLYYSTHGTLGEFGRSEYFHTRYAYVFLPYPPNMKLPRCF
jgi:hypothetical protein